MSTNPWFIFVVGLLIGWLIEWVIDWWYWRRKCRQMEAEFAGKFVKPESTEDDLQKIRGIGPVISGKLNDAGVFTFAQLAELTVTQLEAIVGEEIQRLADEADILRQARDLATRK